MLRKKLIWLSAILIAVSQAVVWGGEGVASAANRNEQSLTQQLIEVNRHWCEVQPNLEALPADWKVDSEVALIRTHLLLVIDHLQRADVSDLDAAQRKNRREHIANLVRYTERGVFPVNQYVQGRRPVFIDAYGTHCAVGQLIADSGQGELAHRINYEHQLAYIEQIETPGVDKWQKFSGLSFAELALIQPSYSDVPYVRPRFVPEPRFEPEPRVKREVRVVEQPNLATIRATVAQDVTVLIDEVSARADLLGSDDAWATVNVPAVNGTYRIIGHGSDAVDRCDAFNIHVSGGSYSLSVVDYACGESLDSATTDATSGNQPAGEFKWLTDAPDGGGNSVLQANSPHFSFNQNPLDSATNPTASFIGYFGPSGRAGTYWVDIVVTGAREASGDPDIGE